MSVVARTLITLGSGDRTRIVRQRPRPTLLDRQMGFCRVPVRLRHTTEQDQTGDTSQNRL